jgi:rubredoxin-NAD+ reductase
LVLAHGAQPIRIALEGDAADQVLSVNQLEDYVLLRQRLQPGARVLIMGAGLIGCEFANDLAGAGFQVQVVDPSPRPLAMLLPEDASRQLAQALSALGVGWHWDSSVTSVKQHDGALETSLNNGTALTVDMVLSAIGLRANTDWLRASGLYCDRGVLVNHTLQTSDPQVYALGDVAQYASADNRTLPYVMPIMTAARALGATLAGKPTEVVFPVMPVAVKTPAYPLLLASPPPQAAGAWVLAEEGVWRFQNAQAQCMGFVLGGGKTSMRAKALQWLAPA